MTEPVNAQDELLALADYLDRLEGQLMAADADMLIDEKTPPSVWADRIRKRTAPSEAGREETRKALEWYASEAGAAARYMAQGKQTTADALLAILTVLANDGGGRARAALSRLNHGTSGD